MRPPLVVERLFAWLSRYRRLNLVYERATDLFAAYIWIATGSILARRRVAHTQPQPAIPSRTHSEPPAPRRREVAGYVPTWRARSPSEKESMQNRGGLVSLW